MERGLRENKRVYETDLTAFLKRGVTLVSIKALDQEHQDTLIHAIKKILSTEVAEHSMAELVDGLPLIKTQEESVGSFVGLGHPLCKHKRLCKGTLEKFREFRENWDPAILRFDSHVTQAFQASKVMTNDFKLRLMELVAVSIHQIAVHLFKSLPNLHRGDVDSVVSWEKPPTIDVDRFGNVSVDKFPYDPRPTLFFHSAYDNHEHYPEGIADMAGYWAEDRIFGGVVVFDRGDTGVEESCKSSSGSTTADKQQCKDIYYHSGRNGTTRRVWRLSDLQLDKIIDFLTSEPRTEATLFPLLASKKENPHRHDDWEAIAQLHIFRDPWERDISEGPYRGCVVRN